MLARLLLAVSIVLTALACDRREEPAPTPAPAASKSGRNIVIGMVAKSQSNDVFQAAHAGARDAARELGPAYNASVTIDWRTPVDEDAAKQSENIDALVRAGVDAILVSCSNADTVTPAIDRAVAKGIPVMTFDSDAPDSKRFAFYGADDVPAGEAFMHELAKAMGGKGTVAILAGNQSAPNLQNRVKGAKQALAQYPGMRLLPSAGGVFYHQETPEKAAEAVMNATNANPEITGWCFIGGWPLFTNNALRWEPGQIKVVSCDALPAQLNYLRSGHVEALLGQDCYGWGYKGVQTLLDKVVHNKTPATPRLTDPLTRVTKANADEYEKSWAKWLGK